MTTNVDVLAVMYAARWCPRMQPQIAQELGPARAAVAELIAAARDAAAVLQAKAGPMEQETPRRLYAALARVEGR